MKKMYHVHHPKTNWYQPNKPFQAPSITRTIRAILAFDACLVTAQLISPSEYCLTPCMHTETRDSNVPVPGTDCKIFYVCRGGRATNRLACSDGRAFDVSIGACNHESLVNCIDPTCPPSYSPTVTPSYSPSNSPSSSPTGKCSVVYYY